MQDCNRYREYYEEILRPQPIPRETLESIMICLGVSPYTLSEILGCSTRAIYKWLHGGSARYKYRVKIFQLERCLELCGVTKEHPLMRRYVMKKVVHGVPPLWKHLRDGDWNEESVRWVIRAAYEKSIRGRTWHRLRQEKKKNYD